MHETHKDGLQLDRIDNDGDYTKDNCRWVTLKENQQHKSITYKMYVNGEICSMVKFCEHYKLPYRK